MAKQLLGKEVTAEMNARLQGKVTALRGKGMIPCLMIIRVGERPDDIAYEKGAAKRAETIGVDVTKVLLPADVSQEELLKTIDGANKDKDVHGVLLLRPLPKHIDDDMVRAALSPDKDVDGITDGSLAGVFTGEDKGFPPCTAHACMEILDHYGIDCTGKKAVVIGRSLVVGKPAAMMLLAKNATVTVCHTRTKNMPAVCREADIIIAAAGRADVVGKEYFSPGQTVIDVGINFTEDGRMTGDVKFDEATEIVDAVTPVPGGVGTVTTSVLIGHVVAAAEKAACQVF